MTIEVADRTPECPLRLVLTDSPADDWGFGEQVVALEGLLGEAAALDDETGAYLNAALLWQVRRQHR